MSGNQQPQGQQNPLAAFGLKPSTTTQASNSQIGGFGAYASPISPFATAGQSSATNALGTNTAPKASLFGGGGFALPQNQGTQQAAASGSSGGGGIFGSSSGSNLLAPNANAAQSNGQSDNSASGPVPSGGGLFGGGSNTTANNANPLFGGSTKQPSTPSTQPKPLFGGSSTPAVPPPSGGLFGSQPNNQTPSAGGMSGTQSTTAPSGGYFGGAGATGNASTPSLGIFGAASHNQNTSSGQSTNAPASSGTTGTSAPPTTSNPLFGNAASNPSSGNVLSQPSPFGALGGAKPTTTSAPASGAPALPALFGGNANKGQASTGEATSSMPSSGTSLFSNLPKKPESSSTPNAPSGFSGLASLATPKDSNKESGKDGKSTALGASSSSDPIKENAAGKDAPAGSSPFPVLGLGGPKGAITSKPSDVPGTITSGSSAAVSTAVPAPSMLRGKTVEDIVSRWTNELEMQTREFSQFASEVAVWDRTLIENGNYISALYATVLAAESTQASLDQSLDHVEQQQQHLNATLDQYEKSASEIFHGPGGIMSSTEGLGLADSERDKSYALAANLYTQLDDLSRSLTQMVESVNSLNLSPGPQGSGIASDGTQDDAISTIAAILNAHLSSLQWIDGSLKEMEGKIRDAGRKIKDTGVRGGVRNGADDGTSKSRSFGLGSSRR